MSHKISDGTWEFVLAECGSEAKAYDLIRTFRGLTPTMIESYINHFKFHWPTEVVEDVTQLGGDTNDSAVMRAHRVYLTQRYFTMCAWLAGASWRQLAHMFQSTPQSIEKASSKIMPAPLRRGLERPKITYTQVTAMWQRYEEMLKEQSIDVISKIPPVIVASLLQNAAIPASDSLGAMNVEHWENDGQVEASATREFDEQGTDATEYLKSIGMSPRLDG